MKLQATAVRIKKIERCAFASIVLPYCRVRFHFLSKSVEIFGGDVEGIVGIVGSHAALRRRVQRETNPQRAGSR